jgi:hypothetical protein
VGSPCNLNNATMPEAGALQSRRMADSNVGGTTYFADVYASPMASAHAAGSALVGEPLAQAEAEDVDGEPCKDQHGAHDL